MKIILYSRDKIDIKYLEEILHESRINTQILQTNQTSLALEVALKCSMNMLVIYYDHSDAKRIGELLTGIGKQRNDIYKIVVISCDDYSNLADEMQTNIDDIIISPFNDCELELRILRGATRIKSGIKAAEAQVEITSREITSEEITSQKEEIKEKPPEVVDGYYKFFDIPEDLIKEKTSKGPNPEDLINKLNDIESSFKKHNKLVHNIQPDDKDRKWNFSAEVTFEKDNEEAYSDGESAITAENEPMPGVVRTPFKTSGKDKLFATPPNITNQNAFKEFSQIPDSEVDELDINDWDDFPKDEKIESQRKSGRVINILKTIVNGVFITILLLILSLALLVMQSKKSGKTPSIGEMQLYAMKDESMSNEIPLGSIMFVKKVNPSSVAVNDMVAFYEEASNSMVMIRRVVKVNKTNGISYNIARNPASSGNLDTLKANSVLGRVAGHVPLFGYVLSIAQTQLGFVLLMFVLCLAAIIYLLKAYLNSRASTKRRMDIVMEEDEA